MIAHFTPKGWSEYKLLDIGDFEKLEKFGPYILIRPEPQAVWKKKYSDADWKSRAHARFVPYNSSSGNWEKFKPMPDEWFIRYKSENLNLQFRLALTSFKHVGLFPEQADNWEFIYEQVMRMRRKESEIRVLNLFAYTGGASLAARAAGADIIHLDSVKQVVSWARDNMELSKLKDIRWVVEDARKFVERELRRGKQYHGIMLDPPAYGLGPKGERWRLEEHIEPMLSDVMKLLHPQGFMVLNTYSLGFSSLIARNLLMPLERDEDIKSGELVLPAESGFHLPLGIIGRVHAKG